MLKKMPIYLHASDYFDESIEMHYAYYQSAERLESKPHIQDYFCMFLVVTGRIRHQVNDQVLEHIAGELCFVRPGDVHAYHAVKGIDSEAININISANAVEDLFDYLGEGFNSGRLLNAQLPPVVVLAEPVKQRIEKRFQQLNLLPKSRPKAIRSALRMLLFELISEYFSFSDESFNSKAPMWFEHVCRQMQRPENFSLGISQMKLLAGVSHEHLSRSFKKYLDTTPTAYINKCRLAYAANLLIHTDMKVTQIALESGFESLSYFHNLFRKTFGSTPSIHRKNHKKPPLSNSCF